MLVWIADSKATSLTHYSGWSQEQKEPVHLHRAKLQGLKLLLLRMDCAGPTVDLAWWPIGLEPKTSGSVATKSDLDIEHDQ